MKTLKILSFTLLALASFGALSVFLFLHLLDQQIRMEERQKHEYRYQQ